MAYWINATTGKKMTETELNKIQADAIQKMLDDLHIVVDVFNVFNYIYVHDVIEYKNNLESDDG